MREILFRGKRLDNGEWVEGYLFIIWARHFILWGTTNDVPNMIEINPSTLCQSTGETGKDDAKLWEGDKVEFCIFDHNGNDYWKTGYIKFARGSWMIWGSPDSEMFGNDGGYLLHDVEEPTKGIIRLGSIHDTEPPCTT